MPVKRNNKPSRHKSSEGKQPILPAFKRFDKKGSHEITKIGEDGEMKELDNNTFMPQTGGHSPKFGRGTNPYKQS
jgi:hypothetical protein